MVATDYIKQLKTSTVPHAETAKYQDHRYLSTDYRNNQVKYIPYLCDWGRITPQKVFLSSDLKENYHNFMTCVLDQE